MQGRALGLTPQRPGQRSALHHRAQRGLVWSESGPLGQVTGSMRLPVCVVECEWVGPAYLLSFGFEPGGWRAGAWGPCTEAWWSSPFQRTLGWRWGTLAPGQDLEVLGVGQCR